MSALGDGCASGETGTVHAVQKMPDQIPDNPGTLVATTSIETIEQVMYRNWIWRNQFTVDTTMLAGHVFGLIKIHPKNCHAYLAYLANIFLTWTGSMKLRSRFQATFQFGGSFRLGWLPPKFTRSQVQNMPIQTLTAYPNIDLDPKNTCWMEFQASEERNILFHWMEDLDSDNPETFGGWFVFYVAAPLVISGGAGSSVTLLVESAGSFNFAQLAPITAISPSVRGILDSDLIFGQVGCEDNARIEAIQIFASSIKSAPLGWFAARASQNGYTRDQTDVILSDPIRTWVTAVRSDPYVMAQAGRIDAPKWEGKNNIHFIPNVLNQQFHVNQEWGAITIAVPPKFYGNEGAHLGNVAYKYIKGNNTTIAFQGTIVKGTPVDNYSLLSSSNSNSTFNFARAGIQTQTGDDQPVYDNSTMPLANNESLLGFVSFRNRSFSIQTRQQGTALAASELQKTNSQLYQLFAGDNPTPLLTIRLTPFGYFTTRGVEAEALLTGKDLYLRYLQDLPMSTPIPGSYSEAKFLRQAAQCAKRNISVQEYDDKLWSRF